MSKASWYKGKAEVDSPPKTSIQLEESPIPEEEEPGILPGTSIQQVGLSMPEEHADSEPGPVEERPEEQSMAKRILKSGNVRKKRRGANRVTITLGVLKKVEKH